MAIIGSAQTRKFSIGTAELRVGPLNLAGRLTQAHSVGLIDGSGLSVEQTIVELKGGFPQVINDTAITEQMSTISGTLREFSRRNLGILMGQGLTYVDEGNDITDASTTLTQAAPKDTQVLSLTAITNFGASGAQILDNNKWHGWVIVYDPTDTGLSFISRITNIGPAVAITGTFANTTSASTSATLSAANTNLRPGHLVTCANFPAGTTIVSVNGTAVTLSQAATTTGTSVAATFGTTKDVYLDSGLAIPAALSAGAVVAKLAPVIVGNVSAVQYFTAQLVTVDRASNRPKVWNFWKCTLGSGMNLTQGATDFASTEMQLKVIQPSLADFSAATAPLYGIRHLLGRYPSGMMGEVSDDVAII